MTLENIMFIHSSVDRHIGCFCLWGLVNNAAVNVYIFFYSYIATLNPVAFSMYCTGPDYAFSLDSHGKPGSP